MRQLRVLLAEDHPLIVEAVKLALDDSGEFKVVATTSSGRDVVALYHREEPDLILLDLGLADLDGVEVLRALRRVDCEASIVVLSAHDGHEIVENALQEGAAAFISKRINPYDLPAALRQVLDQTLFHPAAADGDLSARDLEVLQALQSGLSNREISERLWLTEQGVKARLTGLYRKLGVSSRTEAVAAAYARGYKPAPAELPPRRLTGSS